MIRTQFLGGFTKKNDRETDRNVSGFGFVFFRFRFKTDQNRPTLWWKTEKPTEQFVIFGSQPCTWDLERRQCRLTLLGDGKFKERPGLVRVLISSSICHHTAVYQVKYYVIHIHSHNSYLHTNLSSIALRFCSPQEGLTSFMRSHKTRSTRDRSIPHSLQRWPSTKSSISQLTFVNPYSGVLYNAPR